jgi:hypothetical protein
MGEWVWPPRGRKARKLAKEQRKAAVIRPLRPGQVLVPRRPAGPPVVDRDRLAAISARQMAKHRGEEVPAPRENLAQEARRLGMHPKGLEARRAFEKWRNKGV